jgi:hypothetical protein
MRRQSLVALVIQTGAGAKSEGEFAVVFSLEHARPKWKMGLPDDGAKIDVLEQGVDIALCGRKRTRDNWKTPIRTLSSRIFHPKIQVHSSSL